MPCFKGLAVSIHTPADGCLSEYSVQRQTRLSRINAYIPVPPPRVSSRTSKAEPSSFSVSITLLTPGMSVPYSTPKPTADDPYPRPKLVSSLATGRGSQVGGIGPYEPLTSSPNETIAAYIYFDGRQKEEVATLLRRGEETWVNSRWVGVPASEGGGLAEREFLFREVGLERWLNGLDLEGSDVAATIERRRQKMEKKRRKRKTTPSGSDEEDGPDQWLAKRLRKNNVLRYGADENAPLQGLSDDEEMMSSSDDDSDDDPIPEAAGQIKVALFRVLASGEVKKGEYSPQFDAHDDDEESANGADGGEANIDHTTSFAKPKSLDPKSISTQTVTGIDGPDKPYAVFTFLYRGEKQLQKMGILKPKKSVVAQAPAGKKERSLGVDIDSLKPLKASNPANFTGIRDDISPIDNNGKVKGEDDMDSDDDSRLDERAIDADEEDVKNKLLSPEDAKKQREIADGVRKMRLKRQHSAEPEAASPRDTPSTAPTTGKSPKISSNSPTDSSSLLLSNATYDPSAESKGLDPDLIGSPLKKQRGAENSVDSELRRSSADTLARGLGFGYTGAQLKSVKSDAGVDTNFGGVLGESSKDVAKKNDGADEKGKGAEVKKESEDGMQDV